MPNPHRDRAAVFQALGRYDEAPCIRKEAAGRRASFENVAALGRTLCRARRQRRQQNDCTRKVAVVPAVSPRFPLAFSTSSWA